MSHTTKIDLMNTLIFFLMETKSLRRMQVSSQKLGKQNSGQKRSEQSLAHTRRRHSAADIIAAVTVALSASWARTAFHSQTFNIDEPHVDMKEWGEAQSDIILPTPTLCMETYYPARGLISARSRILEGEQCLGYRLCSLSCTHQLHQFWLSNRRERKGHPINCVCKTASVHPWGWRGNWILPFPI